MFNDFYIRLHLIQQSFFRFKLKLLFQKINQYLNAHILVIQSNIIFLQLTRNRMENLKKSEFLNKILHNYQVLTEKHQYIKHAVLFLQEILIKYPTTTFISFNGGKDATIVLFLTYLAFVNILKNIQIQNNGQVCDLKFPKTIYFEEPNPFPQMNEFYQQMKQLFELQIHTCLTKNYPEELKHLKQKHQVDCIIMGSRKDDPYCQNLQLITQSDIDKGYPSFKRINPIIFWNYQEVWQTIKVLEMPYCSLYNKGYSSIGNMKNTIKNPTLVGENQSYASPCQANPVTERICRKKAEL